MTTRQILKALRTSSKTNLFKSMTETGRTMIVTKPDFQAVPYDGLKDFWALLGYVDEAKDLDGQVVFG